MFNSLFYTIPAAMDAAMLREEVIAHNIANVETPGYKRKDVVFEDELRKILERNDLKLKVVNEKHFSNFPTSISPKIITQGNTSITNDKNNVDIDYEMNLLVQNTLRYQVLSRLLSMNIDRYNTALRSVV
ncbi:MAG TPA: flagellar basal body rod protein FlgB [Thermotogaceae bacterium]|nr:flagellar basal body rod protein FlgB [Thermotogota bacterium]HEW92848.1 flagellar basal body rod protein FlgB [Thermotogaceae bacterium]